MRFAGAGETGAGIAAASARTPAPGAPALQDVERLQRNGSIFGRRHGQNQADGDVRIERLGGGEPTTLTHGRPVMTGRHRALGEGGQETMEVVGQAGPLTLGPPLELHGAGEGEAVEEWTRVEGAGGVEFAVRERAT